MVARVFGAGFGFLVVWSVGVHLATLRALPFDALYVVFAAAAVAAAAGAVRPPDWIFRTAGIAAPRVGLASDALAYITWREAAVGGGLGVLFLLTAGLEYKFQHFSSFWIACLGTGLFALWVSFRYGAAKLVTVEPGAETADSRSTAIVFAALAVFLLAFYFFLSIPDSDDAFFLNVAVGAKEARESLLAHDSMLGLAGLELLKSTYRLESYPLLAAFLSDVTGMPVLFAAHTLVPALVCIWAASCLTLLHTAIFPDRFAVTIVFHIVALIALDGSLQSYGYHAVPRFFQGKGVFVTVLVPLIALTTWCALRDNAPRTLALLAGLIIISIGLTANAIYAGPLTAALVAFPYFVLNAETRWRVLRLAAVVAYPLALAVFILVFDPPSGSEHAEEPLGTALWALAGSREVLLLYLAGLFAAACAALLHPAFRTVSAYAIGVMLFVATPLLWSIYSAYVTGHINVRLFWAVPIPLLLAVLAGVLWSSRGWKTNAVLVLAALAGAVAPSSILRKADYGFASYKVPIERFALATKIADMTGGNGIVLAPESISAWLPTLENGPAVVEGRAAYVPQRISAVFAENLAKRAKLFSYWDTAIGAPMENGLFLAMLKDIGVTVVVADKQRSEHEAKLDALRAAGFKDAGEDSSYRILVR